MPARFRRHSALPGSAHDVGERPCSWAWVPHSARPSSAADLVVARLTRGAGGRAKAAILGIDEEVDLATIDGIEVAVLHLEVALEPALARSALRLCVGGILR